MTLVLHTFHSAAAPYRVRIALNLKGVAYRAVGVDLTQAEQKSPGFTALNPQQLTPALETDEGVLTQSLAILEWIEETWPEPALLPARPHDRAVVRAMAEAVACDIHPLNNMRVRQQLAAMGLATEAVAAWAQRWINDGFAALEVMITTHGGAWCFGDSPTFADCCLIPQVSNSRRFGVDLKPYPRIAAIWARAAHHPAFHAAAPEQQVDYKSS